MPNRTSAQSRPRRRTAIVAMMVGGIATAAFSVTVIAAVDRPGAAAATTASASNPITVGPEDISVVRQVYDPGQNSPWHTHSGIHAVAVLSGTLTVYDAQCRAVTVEPGRPYVGGQEVHRASNETAEPLEMVVTYLSPRGAADSTQHVPPPACAVS